MRQSTRVRICLDKTTAAAVALLLAALVAASNTRAQDTSDIQTEAPAVESVEDGEEETEDAVPTYQAIAQQRANAMARLRTLSHSIHSYRGASCSPFPSSVFEGIGMSSGGTPGTCNNGGRVLADAMAVSADGTVYRVRFFTSNGRNSFAGRWRVGRRR